MAQLPPKVPTMTQNWPSFPHQKHPCIPNFMPSTTTTTSSTISTTTPPPHQPPCWIDEFLDFTSTRRGNHRRSASDSIAFLESPLVDECRNSGTAAAAAAITNNNLMHGSNGFDRLDDEQLMSMFSDDMSVTVPPTLSSSNPSTPSDQNSNNDEKPMLVDQHNQQQPKSEPGEVESSCEPADSHVPPSSSAGVSIGDPIIDPKRVKRILANRQSAQRSRVRKLQYISELERSVTALQSEVSALSPRVTFLDHQRLILNIDNSALKQRIAALAQDKIFKDAHQEALKKEIERLRHVYQQQSLRKMGNQNAQPPPSSTEKEQILN